jgi:protein-tyrosine phosphatase
VRNKLPDIAERLTAFVRAASGTDRPRLSVITDGANGLQSIADRLPFSCTPVLDWFHISMRVRYLEQIVKGMRAKTETEKAALVHCVIDLAPGEFAAMDHRTST